MEAQRRRKVYLLDVSYFTFRAYHALPPLNTASGLPTNAIHGVASMLERLIRTEKPAYLAAVFDAPGPSFRNEIYDQYKANRAEPDEDLRVQFPYVRRLIDAMSIRCVEKEGYEADDLLATLAKRLGDAGFDVVIVTGDKDLMQCVSDRVSLYEPVRDQHVGEREVIEKFGVPPAAVTDVQGLMGDSTDNIPGVRGVGPKTAAALIQHFGSIERMFEHSEEIESIGIRGAAGVRKKIEEGTEAARMSKRLATACEDVDLDVMPEDLAFRSIHTNELLTLAEELEMERLATRIRKLLGNGVEEGAEGAAAQGGGGTGATAQRASAAADGGTAESGSAELAADWRAFRGDRVILVLTDGDDQARCCMAVARGGDASMVAGEDAVASALRDLAAAGTSFSGFDLKRLTRRFGVEPGPDGVDLGVASYLYDPSIGEHGNAEVADRFLREALALPTHTAESLATALDQCRRLVPVLEAALAEHGQTELYRSLEHPLIAVLGHIEARGILLDLNLLAALSEDFESRMNELVARIYEAAGCEFNILSPLQLRGILFEKLGLPTKGVKRTKSGPSTDSDTLHALAAQHPLPSLILDYRALAKLKSTYVDSLPKLVDREGRIHTTLNQTVAATGRLSSKDPNLQNIPIRTEDGRKIRRAFVASPGHVLVSADYNQIELRVLAHLSGDDALIEAVKEGKDIHAATAAEVFGVEPAVVTADMRRAAKVINYGIIYGMGPVRMSRELGITRSEAAEYIDRYFKRYPGVRRFYADMLEGARRDGYVATLLGRRRYLPDIRSDNGGLRQAAERVATNTPIQGSAADIIKLAMIRLAAALARSLPAAAMVLQIHDELLVECPQSALDQVVSLMRECMEGAAKLAVPVVVDIGSGANWAQAH